MTVNGEAVGSGQTSWPTPDDPAFADAGSQTREWLEATQPEALSASMTETIEGAFHALSRLAMFHGAYPVGAFENAMAQLPPERAELLKEQLELSKTYAQDRHDERDTETRLEDRLFNLAMKAASLSDSTEQIAR